MEMIFVLSHYTRRATGYVCIHISILIVRLTKDMR